MFVAFMDDLTCSLRKLFLCSYYKQAVMAVYKVGIITLGRPKLKIYSKWVFLLKKKKKKNNKNIKKATKPRNNNLDGFCLTTLI